MGEGAEEKQTPFSKQTKEKSLPCQYVEHGGTSICGNGVARYRDGVGWRCDTHEPVVV
jgi:hypothetical protein